ncbi:MAG: competence protein ComEA [Actinomycetota bacterium]
MQLSALTVSQRRAAAALAVLAMLLVLGVRHLHGSRATASAVPLVTVRRSQAPAARQVVVDVVGAVRRPGLYRLREGTRIADAVGRAGGATPKADLAQVNLAAPLADGEQVVVPARGAAAAAGGTAAAPGSPTAPVDLNTASPEQLDTLPGVGPSTAAKIIAFRQAHGPFHSLAELDAVPGIGPARLAELKGLVVPS